MILKVNTGTVVVFDLDDTLYNEIDFLQSGFFSITRQFIADNRKDILELMMNWYHLGDNVFRNLIEKYNLVEKGIDEKKLLEHYRNHFPDIHLKEGALKLINSVKSYKCRLGLITDGRSITQRNKIAALGLNKIFDLIVISEEFGSEKPSSENFLIFKNSFSEAKDFIYFGDNLMKDFVTPNTLGWKTICLKDNGSNIHKQDLNLSSEYLPQFVLNSFNDIEVKND